MKKLMIAVAAAAMIGGAYAEAFYDFTASVKTTKGKYGSQKTSYTVNVGLDDSGTYWWDALGFDNEKEAKAFVRALSNDEKAAYAVNVLGFDGVDTDYPNKEYFRGKWVWCYTFKFWNVNEDCYRVPGTAKLKGIVQMDGCCDTWEFISYDFGTTILDDDVDGVSEINKPLLYRFNGVTVAKAGKVEVTGTFGDGGAGYVGDTIGTFAYAGQGDFERGGLVIKSISGNLVGVLENPDCESCCDYNDPAIVFECVDADDLITDEQVLPNGTAAFGTFSLKLNKKFVRQ